MLIQVCHVGNSDTSTQAVVSCFAQVHSQGAGSEVEQLGVELASIWAAACLRQRLYLLYSGTGHSISLLSWLDSSIAAEF